MSLLILPNPLLLLFTTTRCKFKREILPPAPHIQSTRKSSAAIVFKYHPAQFSLPVSCKKLVDRAEVSVQHKDAACVGGNGSTLPYVQTLSRFTKERLLGKVVMVRFDSAILLHVNKENQSAPAKALSTIIYLYEMGAKVVLVGSWDENTKARLRNGACPSTESIADLLSSMLKLKVVPVKFIQGYVEDSKSSEILLLENLFHFKGEVANCSMFAKELALGVDIIVNDAFSQTHKVLASNVGVAAFSQAYIAGFYFEEELCKMKKIVRTSERPYIAMIGGGNLAGKATAVRFLASICDGLVFVGSMAYQMMHAVGLTIPSKFLERGAQKEAESIVDYAKARNIPIVLPKDIWCINDHIPDQMGAFSVDSIPEGWRSVDIGPRSLQDMFDVLSKCKKIIWLGPLKFSSSGQEEYGTSKLAEELGTLDQSSCDITFVGKVEFTELFQKSFSSANVLSNAAVVWEFLKGRKLPGLMALDRAYPFNVDWSAVYSNPTRPLVVDVGSGNGLFLFGMARMKKDMNFLGLEMNAKLVDRCLDNVDQNGLQNVYFIATNATSTFQSIISSYPGVLVLASIQCPNPDFNRPEYRWRMLQRSLVEAIADRLMFHGKVFLQSDIKAVAVRMRKEFLEYGKGKLVVLNQPEDEAMSEGGWLKENPFGVRSDWEQHVLDRGDPMYRILLCKVGRES